MLVHSFKGAWTAGHAREKLGRCIAGLELLQTVAPAASEAAAANEDGSQPRHLYTFQRVPGSQPLDASQPEGSPDKALESCGFELGSTALLSVEGGAPNHPGQRKSLHRLLH